MREQLGWEPWAGENGKPGQLELCRDIGESVAKQLAGDESAILRYRVEAGNGIGKTWICAGFVNWFFDCFAPSLTLTTAPSQDQVELLLWKDIKSQRAGRNLPGRVLDSEPRMVKGPNHWAIGRSTDDSGGKGEERTKGKHGRFLLFVLDEAEGVPAFFWKAVEAMMTGGTVVLVLMIANPRSRTSRFHLMGRHPGVLNYRMSVLDHPNVVHGREIVEGATNRRWVNEQIDAECERVDGHSEDDHTFEVPWRDGIWKPSADFLTMVLGVAPKDSGDRVLVSSGRYEAACARQEVSGDPAFASLGIDAARMGSDHGAGWCLHNGMAWRYGRWTKQDTTQYAGDTKEFARSLHEKGVRRLHVRVDGTGGFGGGVIDQLRNDSDFAALWDELLVSEVNFGENPSDTTAYDNRITELYAEAAETLKGIRVADPPNELEGDLTARKFKWVNKAGRDVKRLEPKEEFRKAYKRSPDDGDAFVLSVAPVHLFTDPTPSVTLLG